MWKREQACFVGLMAAGDGIWAEREGALLTRRAVQVYEGWPGGTPRP